MKAGSSPRVRGTEGVSYFEARVFRFIPACAGNGARPCCTRQDGPVHPRVCGERDDPPVELRRPDGSSPRVRGTGGGSR